MGRYRALAALMAVLFAASEFLTLTRGAWIGIWRCAYLSRGDDAPPGVAASGRSRGAGRSGNWSPLGQRVIIPTLSLSDPSARVHLVTLSAIFRRPSDRFLVRASERPEHLRTLKAAMPLEKISSLRSPLKRES